MESTKQVTKCYLLGAKQYHTEWTVYNLETETDRVSTMYVDADSRVHIVAQPANRYFVPFHIAILRYRSRVLID